MTYKINLTTYPKSLEGVEAKQTTGQIIAHNVLANVAKGNAIRLMSWASKFHAGDDVELDSSDLELLTKLIEENEMTPNWIKASALEILIEAKRKKD